VRERLDRLRWYDLLEIAKRRGPETMIWLTRALLEQLNRGGHLVVTSSPEGPVDIGRNRPTGDLLAFIGDTKKLHIHVRADT
jgi:hypothetical protein